MNVKTALVVSLNYNPGHFSHLVANYRLFADAGMQPYLYLNRAFSGMDRAGNYRMLFDRKDVKKVGRVDFMIFWFPSLENILECVRFRLFTQTKITYVYHEPFDSIRNYRAAGFGVVKILKICLIFLATLPVLLLSHHVILPSRTSLELYRRKNAWLNGSFTFMPLLFDDESTHTISLHGKKNISYIGTIAADHAFDRYVDFLEFSVKNEWFPGYSFLIATASKIPPRERKILDLCLPCGRISISEGRVMDNQEINAHYRDSLVVWNAYHRSNQSGVLPKAFMFGAAVVALARNKSEFVENHLTGVLVDDNSDVYQLKSAVEEILDKGEGFSVNCRNKFLDTFYYRNRISQFLSFVG